MRAMHRSIVVDHRSRRKDQLDVAFYAVLLSPRKKKEEKKTSHRVVG